MRRTKKELQALYEEQNTMQGKAKLEAKKEFISNISSEIGIRIPINEVGVLNNIKTGEKQYFMMIHNERNKVK